MIGVIGGSGFYSFFGSDARSVNLDTPYGEPSAPITVGRVGTHDVAFLPRHGLSHQYSPHTVPYRANMWALRALGVRRVFGPCAVGSLTPELGPGAIVVPDQLVDRTPSTCAGDRVAVTTTDSRRELSLAGWASCAAAPSLSAPS